ncbi:putative glutamate receptor 2 [Apostichopus japonicus]|uniref:Putative glutamate receptor 2 n=1 Tax=Stichopus japonicus TaxID=307972 RepID=A0A2G8KLP4_STIJA|nr:putative glutamate receptor 2 [Apostichopus japonicus]
MIQRGWSCLFLITVLLTSVASENIKIVSMYGKFTAANDLYKEIMIDASTFVNDGNILATGDQINLIHNNALEDSSYYNRWLFHSVFQICNDMRNTGASALIIPNDFCADDCDDVGGIIGDAYSPVLALDQADDSGAFKMVPKLDDVEEMLTEVISHFKWESFIFIHEGGVAYDLVERFSAKGLQYGWNLVPIELDTGNFYEQSQYIKSNVIKNILMYATNEDVLVEVVDTAFETELLSNGWHWIFGNFNPPITQQFLEQKYRHNMAFLTRFKVDSNDLLYYTSIQSPIKDWPFRQRAAYDAVVAVAKAIKMHKDAKGVLPQSVETCNMESKSTLEEYLKQVNFRGASGDVSFDDNGDRVNYTVTMYSGKDKYTENVAGIFAQDVRNWEKASGEKWPGKPGKRMYVKPFRQSSAAYIKILMVTEPPFFMDHGEEARRYRVPVNSNNQAEDEDSYLGISWELLKEVEKVFTEDMEIPFEYRIFTMNRGQYGNLDLSTGEWDGAIREIIDGDADVVMGALVVNDAREKDIDFTTPWHVSYTKLLLLHPTFTFEYPFAMFYPLNVASWFALLGAFLVISILVWLLGRHDKYEWRGRAKRGVASEEDGQTFTLPEAFAFALSTGFWQGYTKGPKSWALRILTVFWCWFTICMTFLYLWNLNTVLKFSKTALKIQDQHDLLMQDQFEFGVVRDSPSFDLYRYGNAYDREIFDRILNSELDLIEYRIEDAVLRMRRQWDGHFTLLGEEKILEYASRRRPCQLYVTAKTLGNMTFAFATASGSPLRDQFTRAINILRNRGVIDDIVNRQYSSNLECAKTGIFKESAKKSFTVHDMQGVYYMMFLGIGGSLIVFVLEGLYYLLWFKDRPSSSSRVTKKRIMNSRNRNAKWTERQMIGTGAR